jgi:hypothetical protein
LRGSAEKLVRNTLRATRKRHSAKGKNRIALEGGEVRKASPPYAAA